MYIDFGILCLFSGDSCLVGCQKFWEVNKLRNFVYLKQHFPKPFDYRIYTFSKRLAISGATGMAWSMTHVGECVLE